MINIFGEKLEKSVILRDKYIEPPFSTLDTKSGEWQRRRKMWHNFGVKAEEGIQLDVPENTNSFKNCGVTKSLKIASEAVFDPVLCEIMYNWFCPEGGKIIDTFSGSSISGIVANKLGYKFTGIDLREDIILRNYEQAKLVLEHDNIPRWLVGDSNVVLDSLIEKFDLYYSCPPYADLVVYSDKEGDLSRMKYDEFVCVYDSIIKKTSDKINVGGYAVFTIGEVRSKDKSGRYYGFVPDTIKAFKKAGMEYYNEAILLNSIGTAMLRTKSFDVSKKLVKVHQNVLVFKKY